MRPGGLDCPHCIKILTDAEVVARVFEQPWIRALKGTDEANWFEATLVVVADFREPGRTHPKSELLDKYRNPEALEDPLERTAASNITEVHLGIVRSAPRMGRLWPVVTERIEMMASAPLSN